MVKVAVVDKDFSVSAVVGVSSPSNHDVQRFVDVLRGEDSRVAVICRVVGQLMDDRFLFSVKFAGEEIDFPIVAIVAFPDDELAIGRIVVVVRFGSSSKQSSTKWQPAYLGIRR